MEIESDYSQTDTDYYSMFFDWSVRIWNRISWIQNSTKLLGKKLFSGQIIAWASGLLNWLQYTQVNIYDQLELSDGGQINVRNSAPSSK